MSSKTLSEKVSLQILRQIEWNWKWNQSCGYRVFCPSSCLILPHDESSVVSCLLLQDNSWLGWSWSMSYPYLSYPLTWILGAKWDSICNTGQVGQFRWNCGFYLAWWVYREPGSNQEEISDTCRYLWPFRFPQTLFYVYTCTTNNWGIERDHWPDQCRDEKADDGIWSMLSRLLLLHHLQVNL